MTPSFPSSFNLSFFAQTFNTLPNPITPSLSLYSFSFLFPSLFLLLHAIFSLFTPSFCLSFFLFSPAIFCLLYSLHAFLLCLLSNSIMQESSCIVSFNTERKFWKINKRREGMDVMIAFFACVSWRVVYRGLQNVNVNACMVYFRCVERTQRVGAARYSGSSCI